MHVEKTSAIAKTKLENITENPSYWWCVYFVTKSP